MERIHIHLPIETIEKLDAIAEEETIGRSAVARKLIIKALK